MDETPNSNVGADPDSFGDLDHRVRKGNPALFRLPLDIPPLTPEEERFCVVYALTGDAVRAAEACGWSRNHPRLHALVIERLSKPRISLRVAQLREKYIGHYGATREEILEGLRAIAFADPIKFFQPSVAKQLGLDLIDPAARQAIQSITYELGADGKPGKVRLKLWSKTKALDMLARAQPLFFAEQGGRMDIVTVTGDTMSESLTGASGSPAERDALLAAKIATVLAKAQRRPPIDVTPSDGASDVDDLV